MEVGFFADSYWPNRDGVAVEVHALARALGRLGHGVTVYAPQPRRGAPGGTDTVEGVSVVRSRSLPIPFYGEYRWPLFPFAALRDRHLAREVDLLHVHTPGPMGSVGFLAARRFGRPLVGTFHTDVYAARESFGGRAAVRLFFWTARQYSLGLYYRCDLTTCPSRPARAALLRHASKPFRRAVEVVPNGIETDRFRPGLDRPDWRARCGFAGGPLMTYLGRLTVDKGVYRFLDALASLPTDLPWCAVVAGTGPEEAGVRARLRHPAELARRVRYVGPVAEEEKPALLAQSELFVLPSTSDTSSVAVLEAMASGVPAVVSDIGGPSEIVQDGRTGRIVPIADPHALGGTLLELLGDDDTRRTLGEAALRWARAHAGIEGTARRFISLYRDLLDGRWRAGDARE